MKDQLTALENLQWLSELAQLNPDREALESALCQVQLRGYEDVLCGSMSEGQRKRVGLARLYLDEQKKGAAWILDEPLSAIDKSGVKSLGELMDSFLGAGGLILLTSHQDIALKGTNRSLRLGS